MAGFKSVLKVIKLIKILINAFNVLQVVEIVNNYLITALSVRRAIYLNLIDKKIDKHVK